MLWVEGVVLKYSVWMQAESLKSVMWSQKNTELCCFNIKIIYLLLTVGYRVKW